MDRVKTKDAAAAAVKIAASLTLWLVRRWHICHWPVDCVPSVLSFLPRRNRDEQREKMRLLNSARHTFHGEPISLALVTSRFVLFDNL